MKGVVFREFIAMVKSAYSVEVADRIISASNLSSDGAYTSVGTYPHQEMVELVKHLSAETDTSGSTSSTPNSLKLRLALLSCCADWTDIFMSRCASSTSTPNYRPSTTKNRQRRNDLHLSITP